MNNAVFEKTIENVGNRKDIKPVPTKSSRTYLVPEPNYHTTNAFLGNLLATEMKKHKCS